MVPTIQPQADLESTVVVPHPGWFLQHPLPLHADLGLGLAPFKSQAISANPVALRSLRKSQSEIKCPSGFGSGLWGQENPEHP